MLILQCTLLNIIDKPETVNRQTGEVIPAKKVLQVQDQTRQKDGQIKFMQHDLSFTGNADIFKGLVGKEVHINVSAYSKDQFNVGYTMLGLHGKQTD
ncbi:hypothetical protein LVJ82_17710 [Vitreoscilla massiliensis]|uniref:Uncharacterized protein n=1 Tax=Vitreoscilla massiliensis TaxID=1689272 RepID=A0ABY4E1Y8_9NEIS|nr:hypothetical protein [Vitreoscilla massiliensis]UOO89254.1 hypothetical protein LVJ82_17710 [Vitreoscilla massiliensis]